MHWSQHFSARTLTHLQHVNSLLAACVVMAIPVFEQENPGAILVVIEGARTKERQQALFDQGVTWTVNSKHLTGDAIDFAVIVSDGKEMSSDLTLYETFARLVQANGDAIGASIRWGGDWKKKDGCHLEIAV